MAKREKRREWSEFSWGCQQPCDWLRMWVEWGGSSCCVWNFLTPQETQRFLKSDCLSHLTSIHDHREVQASTQPQGQQQHTDKLHICTINLNHRLTRQPVKISCDDTFTHEYLLSSRACPRFGFFGWVHMKYISEQTHWYLLLASEIKNWPNYRCLKFNRASVLICFKIFLSIYKNLSDLKNFQKWKRK